MPPSSCTWNVKLAYGAAVGVGRRAERQLAGRDVGHADELPGRDRHAVERQCPVRRQCRDLHALRSCSAGLSLGSVKPKSAAANVYGVSSSVVTVLSVPAGAR